MARRVIGVVAVAEGRAGCTGRELAEIGLGENDRALGQHLFDDRGVASRNEGLEQSRAISSRHEVGLDLVLHQNRDAVQPAEWATAFEVRVEFPRDCDGSGVDVLYCIELRASLIVGFDAREGVRGPGRRRMTGNLLNAPRPRAVIETVASRRFISAKFRISALSSV
jgi:hypothetical protein